MFSTIYAKLMDWSRHQYAPYYLSAVSFIEASVFPIPPDCMLIPMSLAYPEKIWKYASITTIASVLGGLFGYLLGYFFFEKIGMPIVQFFGYEQAYATAVSWFQSYGFWALLMAAFTPIPYKMFTIGAGVSHMALVPFIIASILGRAARFFLVALLIGKMGKKWEPVLLKYINQLGWCIISLLSIILLIYKLDL